MIGFGRAIVVLAFLLSGSGVAGEAEDLVEDRGLKIEVVYAKESILAMMPVYARVRISNISEEEILILSPIHRLGLVVTHDVTRLDPKEKKPGELSCGEQRVDWNIPIGRLYDVIELAPKGSIEKNLHLLFDYPLGFGPGRYLLEVGYSTEGVYGELYPEIWHGSASTKTRFIVKAPTGTNAKAYAMYKDVPRLVFLDPSEKNLKKALSRLRSLVSRYPDTEYVLYSRYLIAECCFHLKKYEQAIKTLEELMPEIGDSPYITSAQEILMKSYRKTGQNEQALDVLQHIDLGTRFTKSYEDILTGAVELKPWRERSESEKRGMKH